MREQRVGPGQVPRGGERGLVARVLQEYGMNMADGGNIALIVDPFSLESLRATDFEVIDHGSTIDRDVRLSAHPERRV